MLSRETIQQFIDRHQMTFGIIFSLLTAMLLTVVSMALYVSSGASRLDLSRPGYERVRDDAQQSASEDAFSATGPMNSEVVGDFQKRFAKHRDTLNKLDTFGTNALDDTELQIAPTDN